jgi:hypothetical protein
LRGSDVCETADRRASEEEPDRSHEAEWGWSVAI